VSLVALLQTALRLTFFLRIILDASTRRFQAHKIYLRAAAATRWVQLRTELFRREREPARISAATRAIDQRLRDVSVDRQLPSPTYHVWCLADHRPRSISGHRIDRQGVVSEKQSQLLIERLAQELQRITDEMVVIDLRTADRRKGYWLDEDPTLDRMLAWIRMQR
jgi:hypothetical protein